MARSGPTLAVLDFGLGSAFGAVFVASAVVDGYRPLFVIAGFLLVLGAGAAVVLNALWSGVDDVVESLTDRRPSPPQPPWPPRYPAPPPAEPPRPAVPTVPLLEDDGPGAW